MGGTYSTYENPYDKGQGIADAGITGVSAINPLIGGFLKIGQGIGAKTMDEDGIYKSRAGEFLNRNINPTQGVTGLVDSFQGFKDSPSEGFSRLGNQLSFGLIGNDAAQERAKANKVEKNRSIRNNLIQSLNANNLSNYNTYGAGDTSIYKTGGTLRELNSDTVEVEGATHNEGGVQLPGVNAEVEDNETIAKDYVFSDFLGFAERHKPIAKQIGKIEKKPLNNERRVSLEILRKKEAALKEEQEQLKNSLGLVDGMRKQLGGNLYKNSLTTGAAFTEPQGTPPVSTLRSYFKGYK